MLKLLNLTQKKLLEIDENLIVFMHPINILHKKSIIENKIINLMKSKFFFMRVIFLFIKNLIKFYITYFKIYINHKINPYKKKISSKIIFLSHKFTFNDSDLYFSDIKKKLRLKKFDTIYIDQLNFFNLRGTRYNLVKSHYCSSEDLKYMFNEINRCFYLIFKIFVKSKNTEKKIIFYLLAYTISKSTLQNYLIFLSLKNMTNFPKLKKIIHTFEGHIFEKYLNLSFKKNINKIETIGYQHTGLNGYENALYLDINKRYFPDKILCISKVDMKIIKKRVKNKNILSIGRHVPIKKKVNWKLMYSKKKIPKVLLLIENNIFQIKNFLSKLDEYKDLIKLTVRPHPEKIQLTKKYLKNLNVTISLKKNFRDELKKNDVLIFQNSTIHYEAIKHGLLVLRLKSQKRLNFMPQRLEKNINIKDLKDILIKIKKIKDLNYKYYYKYSETKFSDLNSELLNSSI